MVERVFSTGDMLRFTLLVVEETWGAGLMSGLFCLGCRKDINVLVVSLGKFLLLAGQRSVLVLL